jgi:hypothetical protein
MQEIGFQRSSGAADAEELPGGALNPAIVKQMS